jgi:hypothetical protein
LRAWLARARAAQGHGSLAIASAEEALSIVRITDGIERGEALARLAQVEALLCAGEREQAEAALATAVKRLEARAARIADPHYRKSFLERVPENGATLSLARDGARESTLDPQGAGGSLPQKMKGD